MRRRRVELREQTGRDTSLNKTFLYNCALESDVDAVYSKPKSANANRNNEPLCSSNDQQNYSKGKNKKLTT